MSWRRNAGPWNVCSNANSAISYARFTSNTASYAISRRDVAARGAGASPISCEVQRLSHSLFVSGRFAMIYVVDAKFFESTAGDTDRCLESSPGVVRDGARVKSPEAVMRRLLRRKVK